MAYVEKGYTTIAYIEDYLLIDIDAAFEAKVKEWIAMMEKYIEKETGRVFIADDAATTRQYQIELSLAVRVGRYLQGEKEITLDDCVAITELKIDGSVVSGTDYLTYPVNSLPITRIKLTDNSGLVFTEGEQNIEVKAKWGHSVACPADISFAATVLVAGVINVSGSMEGEIKTEKLGDYSVTYKDQKQWQDLEKAKGILEHYKKIIV